MGRHCAHGHRARGSAGKTFSDFLAHVRPNPGRLNFAWPTTTRASLRSSSRARGSGIRPRPLQGRGAVDETRSCGGEADFSITTRVAVDQRRKSGQSAAHCVTQRSARRRFRSCRRSPVRGPGYIVGTWGACFAPAARPRVSWRSSTPMRAAPLAESDVRREVRSNLLEIRPGSPETSRSLIRAGSDKVGKRSIQERNLSSGSSHAVPVRSSRAPRFRAEPVSDAYKRDARPSFPLTA